MQEKKTKKHDRTYTLTDWLTSYPEAGTRRVYATGLGVFLKSTYKAPNGSLEELAARYIKETKAGKRDYFKELVDFIAKHGDRPPATVRAYVNATRNFLLFCCNIDIPTKERRIIRGRMPKGRMARTHRDDLDQVKLRAILSHCDVRLRALVLVLVSSGIRVGEALQLKLADVPLDTYPAEVNVRGEYAKEGDYYLSFISTEAKEALTEWLKVRGTYVDGSAYRVLNVKNRKYRPWHKQERTMPSESTIFPFTYQSANRAFSEALKKAQLFSKDEHTQRKSIRIHDLRKFFMSQAKTRIASEVVEAMAGHLQGLQKIYSTYSKSQLADFYLKAEPAILINQDSKRLDELGQTIDKKDKQVTDLMAYNIQLQGDVRRMEERIARNEDTILHFLEEFQGFTKEDLVRFKKAVAEQRSDEETLKILLKKPE